MLIKRSIKQILMNNYFFNWINKINVTKYYSLLKYHEKYDIFKFDIEIKI